MAWLKKQNKKIHICLEDYWNIPAWFFFLELLIQEELSNWKKVNLIYSKVI